MKSGMLPSFVCIFTLFSLLAGAQNYVPYKTMDSWGFVDRNTQKIAIKGFEEAEYFRGGYALVKKEGLWGALDTELDTVIPIQYQKIEYLSENLLKASNTDLLHLFSRKSDFNTSYSDFAFLEGHDSLMVTADKEGKYGLINLEGITIIPNEYEGPPEEVAPGILQLALRQKKFFGLIKTKSIAFGALSITGKEIIPFKYLLIDRYGPELIKAQTATEQHIYTTKGERIEVPKNAQYNKRESFTEIYVGNNKIEVYPGKKEKPVVFQRVIYSEGFAFGEDPNNVFQILDSRGKVFKLDSSYKFQGAKNGYIKFCELNEDKRCSGYGLLSLKGKEILPPVFPAIKDWNEDYAVCSNKEYNGMTGVINLSDKDTVLDFMYKKITLLNCSYFTAELDTDAHFYDPSFKKIEGLAEQDLVAGKTRIAVAQSFLEQLESSYIYNSDNEEVKFMRDCSYESRKPIEANSVALVSNIYNKEPSDKILAVSFKVENYNNKYFLTDKTGLALTTAKYSGIKHHKGDLIIVIEKDTIGTGVKTVSGAVNMEGKEVISSSYDEIKEVLNEAIIVQKYGVMGVISRTEETIIPIRYNTISYNPAGYYLLRKFSKWQIADKQGNIISKKYDDILDVYPDGIFKVKLDDQVFFIDENGKEYTAL